MTEQKTIIKNGRIIDPASNRDEVADLFVQGRHIVAGFAPDADTTVIDANGKIVAPGFIDAHVHLREPGFEYKETVATGARAAVQGGFTAVAAMPNTNPVLDHAALVQFVMDQARRANLARVYVIGAITKGSEGQELAELAEMRQAGAVAFSDDGMPVAGADMMRLAMQYAGMLGAVIISHCEEPSLSAQGVMHEGYYATVLGLKGIPASAEEVMVARDILLARETGCPVHIAHVSTAASVELVRQAKSHGIPVTAEVTPHHFTLTHQAVTTYDTATKVNPPLRETKDVQAIHRGLADDTIDLIVTDHAPHSFDEKNVEYDLAPFGLVGLETAVGLVWTKLVHTGIITPAQAVAKLSQHPAQLLGVPGGNLQTGQVADVTVVDPELEAEVDVEQFASKSRNTPFAGYGLKGLPVLTMVDGDIKYKRM